MAQGFTPAEDEAEIEVRWLACMQLLTAAVSAEEEDAQYGVLPWRVANLVQNVEKNYRDNHVYVYFKAACIRPETGP